MLKSEMERMVKQAGGMMEDQEIEGLEVGFKFQIREGWGLDNTHPMVEYEVIGFAAPQARGRIDPWDMGADEPSVILKKQIIYNDELREAHPGDQFHIRRVGHYETPEW